MITSEYLNTIVACALFFCYPSATNASQFVGEYVREVEKLIKKVTVMISKEKLIFNLLSRPWDVAFTALGSRFQGLEF